MLSDLEAMEHNAWSLYTALGCGPGGRVTDTPTRLVLETPVHQAPYNIVLRFYDEGDRPLDAQVAELVGRFHERDVTPAWLVHPTTDPGVRDALRACGWECAEEIYGMAAQLATLELPPARDTDAGVEIFEAAAGDTELWVELVSWRYGIAPRDSNYLRAVYDHNIGVATRVWVATVDGVPASKVAVHVTGDTAGVYGVVTTADGRGRGLASALMTRALETMRGDGVARTVLHSTPMAHSLYRRLGYQDVATFEVWAAPDTVHL